MENKYHYALGRRKTATATVRLFPGKGDSVVNEKTFEAYVPSVSDRADILTVFTVAGLESDAFYFTSKVVGSGPKSQVGAIKLGLARAIVEFDGETKKSLKTVGLLTRDPRMVERKKPGLRKARRAEQYSRR